jgi:hypothetical protein
MITQLLSTEAEAAAQRYDLLVEGWRALYMRALNEPDFGTPRQLTRIAGQAYSMARTYLDTETQMITDVSDRISQTALHETTVQLDSQPVDGLGKVIVNHVSSSGDYLRSQIAVQIERDIATLKNSISRLHLAIHLSALGSRMSEQSALTQYKVSGSDKLNFYVYDRSSKKWISRRLVRTIWRQHLLGIYNETVLMTLADHGIDQAVVQHANPQSDVHGMGISLNANSSLPTYLDVRDEVFHPNADAILTRSL